MSGTVIRRGKAITGTFDAFLFKGTTLYKNLPKTSAIGDTYYCPDGDGMNGDGRYSWDGTEWNYTGGSVLDHIEPDSTAAVQSRVVYKELMKKAQIIQVDRLPEGNLIQDYPVVYAVTDEYDTDILDLMVHTPNGWKMYGNNKFPRVTGLAITSMPDKLVYYVGETVDLTGLKLHAEYSNGFADKDLTPENAQIIPDVTLITSADTQKIICSYTMGVTKTVEIPITAIEKHVYAFHINSNESDAGGTVTYLKDAVGMTPAYMDYESGSFNYGSWKNAFFMPKPCMVNYDGTVAYYLDEDDYTKKVDGSASEVSDSNFGGNAMIEWGRKDEKIWYRIVPDDGNDTSATVYIANYQIDENYHAWSFINNEGNYVDHFYTSIYEPFKDTNNRLRSISGITPNVLLTRQEEIDYAKANNPSEKNMWFTAVFADITIINLLLILIGKSTDTQTVFGKGRCKSDNTSALTTGTMDNKGLFYGSTDGTSGVKVFGIENYWGNLYKSIAGYICDNGKQKYKLTYGVQDGSNANGYNLDGTDYKTGITFSDGGYISKMSFKEDGVMLPSEVSGSDSTYYTDRLYSGGSTNNYAIHGGKWSDDSACGAFDFGLNATAGDTYSYITSYISCKPEK